jgi:hypothetical protein
VTHSTSEAVPAAYDRGIETTPIEQEMTFKNLKLSLMMFAAVVSLFVLSSVVVG